MEIEIRNTFPKEEKLKSRKVTKELFSKGKNAFIYPFKVFYLQPEESFKEFPQVIFSVPKRNFKRAVDRNLLKRRLREAYRLNKSLLIEKAPIKPAVLGFVYLGKHIEPYDVIDKKMKIALSHLGNYKKKPKGKP